MTQFEKKESSQDALKSKEEVKNSVQNKGKSSKIKTFEKKKSGNGSAHRKGGK